MENTQFNCPFYAFRGRPRRRRRGRGRGYCRRRGCGDFMYGHYNARACQYCWKQYHFIKFRHIRIADEGSRRIGKPSETRFQGDNTHWGAPRGAGYDTRNPGPSVGMSDARPSKDYPPPPVPFPRDFFQPHEWIATVKFRTHAAGRSRRI